MWGDKFGPPNTQVDLATDKYGDWSRNRLAKASKGSV